MAAVTARVANWMMASRENKDRYRPLSIYI